MELLPLTFSVMIARGCDCAGQEEEGGRTREMHGGKTAVCIIE